MEVLRHVVDLFLHLDTHLNTIIQAYGSWTYVLLFLIIFCETGLVVTPFLPGDSLLFTAGALAASQGTALRISWLFVVLCVAAIAGDTLNYWIGHFIGPKVFSKQNVRLLNNDHLERTRHFYERYGGKTIILARFIPIIRTFAPFVAGIGSMRYERFIGYNIVGGIAWIALFVFGGYVFGDLPTVQHNFGLVILAIIVISVLPAVIEWGRQRYRAA
jgi:membrane-associated protein